MTLQRQAEYKELFPDAVLHWFERCGHFPQLDPPQEAARLILERHRSPMSASHLRLVGPA